MTTPDDAAAAADAASAADASAAACRNCGAAAPGKYCPHCGQETSLVLPSAVGFVREAAGRYVAFDGRMWRTLGNLLLRPGFLTREYFSGRRRRYIRPAKLFITLSIAMFAVFHLAGHAPAFTTVYSTNPGSKAATGSSNLDSVFGADASPWLVPLRTQLKAFNRLPRDAQVAQIYYGVLRYAPYAAIALLPVYALLLQLVFLGSASRYPMRPQRYAAHVVYAAHCHAFLFVIGMLYALVPRFLHGPLALWAIAYGVVAMKTVYGGRWSGAILRNALIGVIYLVFFGIAMAGVVVAAIALR